MGEPVFNTLWPLTRPSHSNCPYHTPPPSAEPPQAPTGSSCPAPQARSVRIGGNPSSNLTSTVWRAWGWGWIMEIWMQIGGRMIIEVVDYVTTMAPLVCLSVIMDSLQGVLSGVARGCGWQQTGAYINIVSFYICGIPVAAALGFWLQLRGMGLWIGIQAGAFTQSVLLTVVASYTDWEKAAIKARKRMFEERSSSSDVQI